MNAVWPFSPDVNIRAGHVCVLRPDAMRYSIRGTNELLLEYAGTPVLVIGRSSRPDDLAVLLCDGTYRDDVAIKELEKF